MSFKIDLNHTADLQLTTRNLFLVQQRYIVYSEIPFFPLPFVKVEVYACILGASGAEIVLLGIEPVSIAC